MTGGLDMGSYDYSVLFRQLIEPLVNRVYSVVFFVLTILLAMLVYAFMKYRLNPFRLRVHALRTTPMRFKLFSFLRWMFIDLTEAEAEEKGREFNEYGFTVYCGCQGAGKTMSMVDYLERMRKKFPKALIVTNFYYAHATHRMQGWRDLFEIRNGEDGVIFAIDEIHSEYSNAAWKDFPEELLSEISQQRKQRVKIVATSQVYSRIAKPIREQCFSVIQCVTFGNRWTFTKEYDAVDYELYATSTAKSTKLRNFARRSFVQGDYIRGIYDTFEKIERLEKMDFLSRNEKHAG